MRGVLVGRRASAGAALLVAFGIAAVGLPGCGWNWRKSAFEAGLGSLAGPFTVLGVDRRGEWLDVKLRGSDVEMRSFVSASDASCVELFTPESQVGYVERGIGGRFERGDLVCEAAGVGEPLVTRTRRPRSQSLDSTPIPREPARYRAIYQDDEVALLRGYFPLAYRVGWSGGQDSIAVVPNGEPCRDAVSSGNASMEFRPAGDQTLSLVSSNGLCPIVGLIRPREPS